METGHNKRIIQAEDDLQSPAPEQLLKILGDLALLAEMSAKASNVASVDQVLAKALHLAIENTGTDCGSILLVTNSSKTLGEKTLKGLTCDPLNAIHVGGLGSMAYQMTQRKQMMLTRNIQNHFSQSEHSKELEGIYGAASYPILAWNLPLGLINLYATQYRREFGKAERHFLTALSNILGPYLLNCFCALKHGIQK
jgi:GAF domain-containing protein